ncbi:MAG TPA: hypothetical protein VHP33_32915 [Polyangiaceae bacterium]|nr:hypothetical protein [Polyangiaceae bacterium]
MAPLAQFGSALAADLSRRDEQVDALGQDRVHDLVVCLDPPSKDQRIE